MCFPKQSEGWQIDKPRTLLANPLLQMVASRVRCGRTGKSQDFYRFEFPRWVNVVATTAGGEMLLIHQYRFGTNRVSANSVRLVWGNKLTDLSFPGNS